MPKKPRKKPAKSERTTNAKPVSLYPLSPEDAVKRLLETPPKKKKNGN